MLKALSLFVQRKLMVFYLEKSDGIDVLASLGWLMETFHYQNEHENEDLVYSDTN